MRWFAVLAMMLAVTAVGCSPPLGDRLTEDTDPKNLILRLPDLPAGYRVGDDSGCGSLGLEGSSDMLADAVRNYEQQACTYQFENHAYYMQQVETKDPPLIESAAVVFDGEEGANAGFDVGADLVEFLTGVGELTEADSPAQIGDETAFFRASRNREGIRLNEAAALVWRDGRVVSFVLVAKPTAPDRDTVEHYARKQQQHLINPSDTEPKDFDDRLVPLESPNLGVDVYWLGPGFDPDSDELPLLALREAYGPLGPGQGPGNLVEIEYTAEPERTLGVDLTLWEPDAWETFLDSDLGSAVWDSPCADSREIQLDGGRAVIHAGYSHEPSSGQCPAEPPDRFIGHVYFENVVVGINLPNCLACVPRTYDGADPYNSWAGMEAIARGLHEREPNTGTETGWRALVPC